MNTKQLLEWSEIAKQVEAGKVRQWRHMDSTTGWRDVPSPAHGANEWLAGSIEYRIKPDEPQEVWLSRQLIYYGGGGVPGGVTEYATWTESKPNVIGAKLFREVI